MELKVERTDRYKTISKDKLLLVVSILLTIILLSMVRLHCTDKKLKPKSANGRVNVFLDCVLHVCLRELYLKCKVN